MYNNSEVVLAINIAGTQALRGIYDHSIKVGSDGKEIDTLITEHKPIFSKCTKSIRLSNEFVKDALTNVPPEIEGRVSQKRWNTFSEQKKIGMAIHSYVNSVHPNHRTYTYEIIK